MVYKSKSYRASIYGGDSERESLPVTVIEQPFSYRSAPYRTTPYRGFSTEVDESRDIMFNVTYPYPALSGNDYSYGVIQITDTAYPFTPSGIELSITNRGYRFNRNVNSIDHIPMCWDTSILIMYHSGIEYRVTLTEEPLNRGNNIEFYTVDSVDYSTNYLALIDYSKSYRYFMNIVYARKIYSNTGPLINYAVENLLSYLSLHLGNTRHVCLTNDISMNLLTDYRENKRLFYTAKSGNEINGVWRSLPEKQMIVNTQSSIPGKTRENLIEFLVKELYTYLEEKWNELTGRK